jgi:hypothetical protein
MDQVMEALLALRAQIDEIKTEQQSLIATTKANTEKLDQIDARLVVVENRSRAPSRSPSPPPRHAEEKKTSFEDAPPSPPAGPLAVEHEEENFYGPTGLPNTPAPKKSAPKGSAPKDTGSKGDTKSPDDTIGADRSTRRDTMHVRSVRKAVANSQRPVVHGILSSYDHIRLKKLNIYTFFKFWEDVLIYEQREQTLLPVTTLIDDQVRGQLISKNRSVLDDAKFFELTQEELYDLMQKTFAPEDRMEFYDKLRDNVEFVFSAHFRPTPEYFQPFYDALILYSARFLKIYEILAHKRANDSVLPRADNKESGTVKLFVTKIPFEYGTRLLLLLDKNRWDDIYLFISDFTSIVDKHKECAEAARKLRRMFGGTQYEAKKFEQKLQHLQQLQALPVDPAEHDQDFHEALTAAAEELDDEIDGMIAALQHPPQHGREPFKKEPYDKSALPKDPLVCITKLLYGTCTKATCSYSHKEELIAKKRVQFIDLIQKQLAAAKPSAAQRQPHRVSVVDDIYDDDQY